MKDDMTREDQEIWSAIRYLDPDEKRTTGRGIAMVVVLALALLVCFVMVELRLRGL